MMDPDREDDLADQKVRPAEAPPPLPLTAASHDIVKALGDRQLGYTKGAASSARINASAEDELVRKQFKETHCELPGVPRSTFLMVFSPDGTMVASTHGNHQIYVTDVRTGKHVKTLVGHPRTPWCIAFHPTSNQIIASGCLGGEVRIWDLSGGSEVWTALMPSAIASIAFHPNDRLLVIATHNQMCFWDWSMPVPFIKVATATLKEKVRYVAFDKLGHKLITGITNSPQTRWEVVRTVPVSLTVPAVPLPTQAASARGGGGGGGAAPTHNSVISSVQFSDQVSPRRIARRLIASRFTPPLVLNPLLSATNASTTNTVTSTPTPPPPAPTATTEPVARTNCYRELVHQSEMLVHRYLQTYRRPTMIDQGTDPMEVEGNSNQPAQQQQQARPDSPIPSTSGMQRSRKPPTKNRHRQPPINDSSSTSTVDDDDDDDDDDVGSAAAMPVSSAAPSWKSVLGELRARMRSRFSPSSEDSDDDEDAAAAAPAATVANRNAKPAGERASSSSSWSPSASPPSAFTKVRQLRLKSPATQPSVPPSSVDQSTETESICKLRVIKCSPGKRPRNVAASSSTETPQPTPAPSSPPKTTTATGEIANGSAVPRGDDIDTKRGGLRMLRVKLPPAPCRSAATSISTGTNTNEESPAASSSQPPSSQHPQPKRKRRLLRPNLLYNMLFTSSDDSSSDSEPQTKVPKAAGAAAAGDSNSKTSGAAKRKRPFIKPLELHPSNASGVTVVRSTEEAQAETTTTSSTVEPETIEARIARLNRAYDAFLPGVLATIAKYETREQSTPATCDQESSTVDTPPPPPLPQEEEEGTIPTVPPPPPPPDSLLCDCCGVSFQGDSNQTAAAATDGCARTSATTARPSPHSPRCRFAPRPSIGRLLRTPPPGPSTARLSFAADDEVVNYAERDGEEPTASSTHTQTPSETENGGIGSMYSNIVAELESSLNYVRNIRFRLGETQSNTILRNLSSSLEDPPANRSGGSPQDAESPPARVPRPETNWEMLDDMPTPPSPSIVRFLRSSPTPGTTSNPINSDHTYPINPDATQAANLAPLHLSLQRTVTHIQRQTLLLRQQVESIERIDRAMIDVAQLQMMRQTLLLRQQVESIERIDRAMIEVAQLKMMRQMFNELHAHFGVSGGSGGGGENRNGVSRVRQMMAGTRISDSSPYDSPSDDAAASNTEQPSTSATTEQQQQPAPPPLPSTTTNAAHHTGRSRARKTYPRCLFLMRQCRRPAAAAALVARRTAFRYRDFLRRNIYRRFLPSRATGRGGALDSSSFLARGSFNLFNPNTLPSMTRRLEHYLMEHCRYIGRAVIPRTSGSGTRSEIGERVMTLRLNNCRQRLNRIVGGVQPAAATAAAASGANLARVTADGTLRFAARQELSFTLDTITRFIMLNPAANITGSFRAQLWEVIELSLLLSELLLLQIVDSIPPPSEMNLDAERENLSMRIDQMCTRMIQTRLMGQLSQLTRSLRLMLLTVRHVDDTWLLDDIHNSLRNLRRYRELPGEQPPSAPSTSGASARRPPASSSSSIFLPSPSRLPTVLPDVLFNNETGEEMRPPTVTVEDANSSDEEAVPNRPPPLFNSLPRIYVPYRTQQQQSQQQPDASGGNRGRGEEDQMWSSPMFPVPTVQVNDGPVPEVQPPPQHLWRARTSRLSERLDELRTVLRPRFLHPFTTGVVYPFAYEDNLEDAQRDRLHDTDVLPTVSPHHRIQVWEFSQGNIPNISNAQKNVVVNECKINNDASVDFSSDGSILVTLLPSYMNVTHKLGVYSLDWASLGQCLYVTSFEQAAVSVSLSPTNRHLLVGLASRRVSILPTTWTMARIFMLDCGQLVHGNMGPVRELEQNHDSNFMSVNCIRWLPTAGQGLIFGTNTGHLRLLT